MAAKITRQTLYLLLLYQICGITIFLKGFFPLKRNSPGFSSMNASGVKVPSCFDRLVFIMIDALRADFVFGEKTHMTFTKGLIDQGNTFSFTAHSHPPTVTMPRIKAITTGTIPGFVDVILNVDSTQLLEDNIITQMKMSNLTMNFFGDDTWLRLFPGHFKRTDGTTSFFVTDYTEVDNNVTRHLQSELAQNDWHVLVLHYLGLDHIGHLAGPTSPLMRPKLNEMDHIIQMIYTNVVEQDKTRNISTLIVLCGDHGMSDGGSHGGSSKQETTTPLVFMSSLFQHGRGRKGYLSRVNQIDIAPTLSLLMGFSIPKNNLGIIASELFSNHSPHQRLEALRMNALQIFEVFEANVGKDEVIQLDQAVKFHEDWLTDYHNATDSVTSLNSRAQKISQIYIAAMQVMINQLSTAMSSYDNHALAIGIWMLVQSLFGTVCVVNGVSYDYIPRSTHTMLVFFIISSFATYGQLYLCSTTYLGTSELFCTVSAVSVVLSAIFLLSTASTLTILLCGLINNLPTLSTMSMINEALLYCGQGPQTFLMLGLVLHNISLLSSSFIEEEHQTWYFLTTTYHLILVYSYLRDAGFTITKTINVDNNKTIEACNSETTNVHNNSGRTSHQNHKEYEDSLQKSRDHIQYNGTKASKSGGNDELGSLKTVSLMFLALLCCDRVARSWNQTGIKWAEQLDFGDWLMKPTNKSVLSCLLVCTLVGISAKIYFEKRKIVLVLIFSAGACGLYIYRGVTGVVNLFSWLDNIFPEQGIAVAQFVHFCVVCIVSLSLIEYLKSGPQGKEGEAIKKAVLATAGDMFLVGYILLISLLLRAHKTPLVALLLVQTYIHQQYIWNRYESIWHISLSAHFLGWFTYFSHGNSNSLATVDLAAGYVGLRQDHSVVFVGILANLATFCGPLFWMISALVFVAKQENDKDRCQERCRKFCTILFLIKTTNVTVCAIMCWINRYHLFVWSVFSPKILYEAVICIVLDIFIVVSTIIY